MGVNWVLMDLIGVLFSDLSGLSDLSYRTRLVGSLTFLGCEKKHWAVELNACVIFFSRIGLGAVLHYG